MFRYIRFNVILVSGLMAAGMGSLAVAGNTPTQNAAPLSFEEFKYQCTNFRDTPTQAQPQNIKLQCTDAQREYIAAAPGSVTLNDSRQVTTALFSNKWYVAAAARAVPLNVRTGSCLRFKEVEKTLTLERALTCADVVNFKGTLDDICLGALDAAKASNPKLVAVADTGKLIDTCASVGEERKGK